MTRQQIQPIIMSGGAGTRLWPLSRAEKPKQFLAITSEKTMLQETASRLSGENFAAPVVICGNAHTQHISDQLSAINCPPAAIITEPIARNTAAVAATAAQWTAENNPNAMILLAPADHFVAQAQTFRDYVFQGVNAALNGEIVTFGIKAETPHTGYGYIKKGANLYDGVFKVDTFLEKPDRSVAESYLQDGNYFWNAGIFLFSPQAMVNALETFEPEIMAHAANALRLAGRNGNVLDLNLDEFSQCPSNSIDYAVMEKTDRAAMVAPVDVGWNDIGSWTELPDHNTGDADQSIAAIDCTNTTIKTDGVFVGAIGLDDMIVVATKDAVLVAPKNRAQDVKKIVEQLKQEKRDSLL